MTERRSKLLVVAAVWLSFLLVSLISVPIPAVNEPHYLAKAKHYWDSSWCANDLFLQSFPAHRVFYQTFGWLTLWLDLATVAVIGRAVGLAMLAASWSSLIGRLQRDDTCSKCSTVLLSAWLFLGLQAIGNLSGEWLIGGFESKVVAYAFVFWAISAMLDRRPLAGSLCSGAAISFHPIIGLWHLLACACTWSWQRWRSRGDQTGELPRLIHLGLGTIVAMIGVVPLLQMLQHVDARTSFAANYIQVFYRLKHHLDPMDFGLVRFAVYGGLLSLWLTAMFWPNRKQALSSCDRWWIGYVLAAALFAFGGLLAGLGERPAELMSGYRWRMVLLKFYPFRLFDLLLPIAVASLLPRLASRRWLWPVGCAGLGLALMSAQLVPPRIPAAMKADWRDACRWIAANTPADAVFLTPEEAEAFKWFAQRSEYVNKKDCPQDAKGIVEWNRRLRLITKWSETSFASDASYSADELRDLVRRTGIRFAIIRADVRYEADLLYANETYKILRLPEDEKSSGRSPNADGR